MSWYRRNWYWVGGAVAAAALIYLLARWSDMGTLERVLVLGFALVPLHELEEYGWPGGEPAIMNKVIRPSDRPDRYPLNQLSAMVVNVFAWYPVAFVPLLFVDQIWLGLGTLMIWIGQFVVHGVLTNRRLKTLYNPGALTMLLGLGLLAYYISYIVDHDLASVWDWVGAALVLIAFAAIFLVKMTYDWLADENSRYTFTDAEMRRWDVDAKLARLRQTRTTQVR